MGVCIGTISWNACSDSKNEDIALFQLRKIMDMYNLKESDVIFKHSFYVAMSYKDVMCSGGSIRSKQKIEAFLEESKSYLQHFGLKNIDISCQYVPYKLYKRGYDKFI